MLEILQLADSALPIGAAAHSFGLESLAEEGLLSAETVEDFLRDLLSESGTVEAVYLRRAWRGEDLAALSLEFDARRLARESREASFKMGRRFVELFHAISGANIGQAVHYPIAFGAAGAIVGIPEDQTTLAYLQQSITGLVSACQRLMPLGQVAASRIIWNLREAITCAAEHSKTLEVSCFSPLPELASMRHRTLETRLFIS
jgi:urease accessory protein